MQSLQKTVFHLDERKTYRKLFPELKSLEISDDQLKELTELMIDYNWQCEDSRYFSNGLAIFGQLLAHDMTFEVTSKFRGYNQVETFFNDRTIRLDLDCLYGQWNQDFLYDASARDKLLLGEEHDHDGITWSDLQRNTQGKAIIPDARNDENIIVSQLHILFILFHNKMIDKVKEHCSNYDAFQEARKQVIWHYQWLILHEYLYKITDWVIFRDILKNGPKYFVCPDFLPLEFTGAIFRTGHSQTRETNRINKDTEKNLFELGAFSKMEDYVDWHFLFDFGDDCVEYARLIDTKIGKIFHDIPFIKSGKKYERSLPYRNLKRSVTYGLASGEDIARRMCIEPLDIEETSHLHGTPLWYYVLKEAELLGHGGEHLGPLGSRIMLESFLSILNHDKHSFLVLHPKWKPEIGRKEGEFDFVDLVNFVND
ncbi:MAG: hypothetical protein KAQ79_05045 [Cyclobacteriaceae bacterium]|nr:hypothetical protein [Cyclobacteriaceae bacterium]